MRGNFSNFATTNLAGGASGSGFNMLISDMSFLVSPGTGSTFPSVTSTRPDAFLVAIDTEVMLCSARSGDTITVLARGYEGTTVASHTVGAVVVAGPTAGALMEYWAALADTYNPDVPPFMRGGSAPSAWNDEFETSAQNAGTFGNWTFTPNDGGQYHSAHYDYRSQCFWQRNSFIGTTYWLYQPFTPGASVKWTVTVKMSHSVSLNSSQLSEINFFVADIANPSVALDSGNRIRIDSGYRPTTITDTTYGGTSGAVHVHGVAGAYDKAGAFSWMKDLNGRLGGAIAGGLVLGQLYYSLSYDGGHMYSAWIGDGYTYQFIGYIDTFSFTPASLGFRFYAPGATNSSDATSRQYETCMIDWVRVVTGRCRSVDADVPFLS